MIVRFKRFSRPQVLKRIGRELLERFFVRFAAELAGLNLPLPATTLDDSEYYGSLARLLAAPEMLPDELNEALFAIDEMATPEGQEHLELAAEQAGLELGLAPGAS